MSVGGGGGGRGGPKRMGARRTEEAETVNFIKRFFIPFFCAEVDAQIVERRVGNSG